MMETLGLIIKTTNYGEGSKIITMLTPQGKMQMVANGARSHKCHLFAGSQLFCYSRVVLQKGRGALPYLKSCDIIENFYQLRMDVERLALAAYFGDLLELMALGEDCEQVLRLILNTLYILETKEDGKYIKPVFELRFLCLLGFQPHLDQCVRCGAKASLERFSALEGGILCQGCSGGAEIMMDTLAAMRYIVSSDGKALFSFSLSNRVEKQLIEICEDYLLNQLERKPKTLEYYNKITRYGQNGKSLI